MAENNLDFIRCPCCGGQIDKNSSVSKRFVSDFCELRTPINSIIGFSSALLDEEAGPINDKQRDNLNIVAKSGEHLLWLINDIIDTAKIWSGELKLQCESVDLLQSIDEVLVSTRLLIQNKPIQLNLELVEIPKIYADPLRVKQILINLFSNSAKYTKEGSITIRVQVVSEDDRPMVQTTVRDTGDGFTAEISDAMLDPFNQMTISPMGAFGIDGLSLPIAKGLAEIQGGRLWMESELGKGSAIHFTLPTRD